MTAAPRPRTADPARSTRPTRGGAAAPWRAVVAHGVVGEPAAAVVRPARRPSAPPERPPLLLVPPRVRRRRAGLLTAAACTALFAVMLGLVAFQMRIAQGQGRLDRLERDIRAEELRYDRLRLEVARLQSPEQVVAAAKALGMVEPDAITYVVPPADVVAAADAAVGGAPPGAAPVGGSPWGAVKPVLGAAP